MTSRTTYTTSWGKQFARAINAPFNAQTDLYFRAWAQAEGCLAAYNPFATTLKLPGATPFNVFTAGNGSTMSVYNYATWQSGVKATADTITNGRYDGLVAQIRKGVSANEMAKALKASPWGTGALTLEVLAYTPRDWPMGEAYGTPPVAWSRTITPGMVGPDVDELLRCINRRRGYPTTGTIGHKWYTNTTQAGAGNPVEWVKRWQLARPYLWKPDGIVGPKSYASICGHP
jgi:hypothetical protein